MFDIIRRRGKKYAIIKEEHEIDLKLSSWQLGRGYFLLVSKFDFKEGNGNRFWDSLMPFNVLGIR